MTEAGDQNFPALEQSQWPDITRIGEYWEDDGIANTNLTRQADFGTNPQRLHNLRECPQRLLISNNISSLISLFGTRVSLHIFMKGRIRPCEI